MNEKQFAIFLSILVFLDSWFTIKIGHEANFIFLWIMDRFDLTLGQMMFWRLPFVWGLIYLIYRFGTARVNIKHTTLAYFGMYVVLSGAQFYQYFSF